MDSFPARRDHYHTLSGLYGQGASVRIKVYPSNVDVHFEDGCVTSIDVGVFYMMFAAHMYQNGLWSDIDWTKVPEGVQQRYFEGYGLPKGEGYSTGGGIYGIKRTFSADVPQYGYKPPRGVRALKRRRARLAGH